MAHSYLTDQERFKLRAIQETIAGTKTNGYTAKLLNLSLRQVKRLKKQVRDQGETAIIHKLKNKPGNRSVDTEFKTRVISLVRTDYTDFKPTLATEKLQERHDLVVNPETLRLWMSEAKLWQVRKQKGVTYRALRERLDYFGEMEQFDGSYHYWFEDRLKDEEGNSIEVCLLASIDDATGKITKAVFALNEGVEAVFTFWQEYVKKLGKPSKVYLDKFSTYKINHKAAVDNSELLTQFQVAMSLLNIELIPANSPEAKGRIERLFQTLQDRLVKELRLASISTITEANQFLKQVFIPQFNAKFSVVTKKTGDVHRTLTQKEQQALNSIFSIKHLRHINNDFTIQFKNQFYQLEEIQPTTIRPKEKITVEEHLDGTIHFMTKDTPLNLFILPERPKRIVKQPVILTSHPLNFKPSTDHPWRKFKYGRG